MQQELGLSSVDFRKFFDTIVRLLAYVLAALAGMFTFISVLQSRHLSGKFLRLLEYTLG